MNWLYYIPHDWEDKTTTTWEDIWLIPEIRDTEASSFWITVDTLGMHNLDEERVSRLGNNPFLIEGEDMLVPNSEISKKDLLEFAKVWLKNGGYSNITFKEGTIEDFGESNEHAVSIAKAKRLAVEIETDQIGK